MVTRVQIDCVLRAFASTLVDDSTEFCKRILIENVRINTVKDKDNNKLTDRYLCEVLGEKLGLPIYDLYQKVSGFVHFSSDSFYNMAKAADECDFTIFIGRNNKPEDQEKYEKPAIELANQFYFFGRILIEVIFASWKKQKNNIIKEG